MKKLIQRVTTSIFSALMIAALSSTTVYASGVNRGNLATESKSVSVSGSKDITGSVNVGGNTANYKVHFNHGANISASWINQNEGEASVTIDGASSTASLSAADAVYLLKGKIGILVDVSPSAYAYRKDIMTTCYEIVDAIKHRQPGAEIVITFVQQSNGDNYRFDGEADADLMDDLKYLKNHMPSTGAMTDILDETYGFFPEGGSYASSANYFRNHNVVSALFIGDFICNSEGDSTYWAEPASADANKNGFSPVGGWDDRGKHVKVTKSGNDWVYTYSYTYSAAYSKGSEVKKSDGSSYNPKKYKWTATTETGGKSEKTASSQPSNYTKTITNQTGKSSQEGKIQTSLTGTTAFKNLYNSGAYVYYLEVRKSGSVNALSGRRYLIDDYFDDGETFTTEGGLAEWATKNNKANSKALAKTMIDDTNTNPKIVEVVQGSLGKVTWKTSITVDTDNWEVTDLGGGTPSGSTITWTDTGTSPSSHTFKIKLKDNYSNWLSREGYVFNISTSAKRSYSTYVNYNGTYYKFKTSAMTGEFDLIPSGKCVSLLRRLDPYKITFDMDGFSTEHTSSKPSSYNAAYEKKEEWCKNPAITWHQMAQLNSFPDIQSLYYSGNKNAGARSQKTDYGTTYYYTYGDSVTISAPTYKRAGYTFSHFTLDGAKITLPYTISKKNLRNYHFVSWWKPVDYNIYVNTNGYSYGGLEGDKWKAPYEYNQTYYPYGDEPDKSLNNTKADYTRNYVGTSYDGTNSPIDKNKVADKVDIKYNIETGKINLDAMSYTTEANNLSRKTGISSSPQPGYKWVGYSNRTKNENNVSADKTAIASGSITDIDKGKSYSASLTIPEKQIGNKYYNGCRLHR